MLICTNAHVVKATQQTPHGVLLVLVVRLGDCGSAELQVAALRGTRSFIHYFVLRSTTGGFKGGSQVGHGPRTCLQQVPGEAIWCL